MTTNSNSPTVPQQPEIASRAGNSPTPSAPRRRAGDLFETTYPVMRPQSRQRVEMT